MEFLFRQAEAIDLTEIMAIISQAVSRMMEEGKQQWDTAYPTSRHIAEDIGSGDAYVIVHERKVVAYGAVVFTGEPAYDSLQGRWLSEGRSYVVVHRMAVAQSMQGRGLGVKFLKYVEELAKSRRVCSFRIDTNFDNFPMLHILEKCGFAYCGDIWFCGGARRAYEKLMG